MTCTNDCRRPTPAQAHCGACHRTFGSASGFDKHRRDGQCLDPATLKVPMTETDGIWRWPLTDDARSRLRERRQSDEHASEVPG
jgi:hypothetical protein